MKARLDDDEDMMRVQGASALADTMDVLELHSGPGLAEEAKTFGISAVDLREVGISRR